MYFSRLKDKGGLLGVFLALARFVSADCECGYSVNRTGQASPGVFTDLLESDFTRLHQISVDKDWVLQEWSIDATASHGPYGRKTELKNAVSNPAKDLSVSDQGIDGRQAGLELYVRKLEVGATQVSVVEVDTFRSDMLYGTFRAGIKTTGINGTCGAFFWYLNDTQEIDMEFLSSQLSGSTSPVNLVLHSTQSLSKGGDASGTPAFKVIQLPFEADKAVHEYRFDWQPHKVSFYADGQWLADMTEDQYIPSAAGKIVLSHWSNGNPLWSTGPPEEDAFMLVQYVKAYFNTTDPQRLSDYSNRCKDRNADNSICVIPDQTVPPLFGPNAGAAKPYFFSQDSSKNKTVNQTVWGEKEDGKKSAASSIILGNMLSSAWIVAIAGVFVVLL